ncbi:unnamed protein product [Lota lota]
MPTKPKKSTGSEETKDVDDEVENSEPKLTARRKNATERERSGSRKHKSRESSADWEIPSPPQSNGQKKNKKKGQENVKEKKKKKKTSLDGGIECGVVTKEEKEDEGHEQNNNNVNTGKSNKRISEKFPEEEVTDGGAKEEKKRTKNSKSADPEKEDEMGSKDKKKKKKKSAEDDDDEEALLEEQEEDSKIKKKKKPKDDDDKKKKKKKSKQVDYAEIYQNELLNYNTDSSDGYEDEYYKKKVYEVVTVTGDVKGAGTDANVFVTLFGDFGVTPKVHLASKSRTAFEKNKTDVFHIKTHNVGPLKKLRIEHDNTGMNAGWFLDRVVVTDVNRPHLRFYFPCNNWLSQEEADNLIVRDLLGSLNPMDIPKFNKYIVSVFTADMKGSGTDADVFLNIFGEHGDTGERRLDSDKDNFERGTEDKFTIDSPNLGRLRKITIGHNNRGSSAGWFLDKVVVDDMGNKEVYEFPVNHWFAMDEADGKIQRDILVGSMQPMAIVYNVQVMTGDIRGAGTNSKIHIVMHGAKGVKNSGKVFLEGGLFERGLIDIFNVEICELISPLSRVTIGHDNGAVGAGWYCEKIKVEYIEELREVVDTLVFPSNRWLARDEEDGEIVVELLPEGIEDLEINSYEIHVFSGSLWGAGTDANVYITIYGEVGDTGERWLRRSNHLNKFEKNQEDIFNITAVDMGVLKKLRIRHDNSNANAAWFLERVEITDNKDDTTYYFPCKRWLAIDEDDGQIARELVPVDEAFMRKGDDDEEESSTTLGLEQKAMSTTYTLKIKTGEKKYAGTDANVFIVLFGIKDDTGIINLKASKTHRNKFELGMIDEFIVEAVNIGPLQKLRIGHDNNGGGSAGWFLDCVEIDAQSLGQKLCFPCGRWLDTGEDDGAIVRDLFPNPLQTELYTPFVPYEIKIFTSDLFGAGTDADVFIVLYGRYGVCTQQKRLCFNKRERIICFERGAEDMFIVELEDVGDVIEKIRIGHDNRGVNPGWHLDRVEIRRLLRKGKGSETIIFPCECWLAKSEDDGETVRELVPSDIITEKLGRDGSLKVTEIEVEDALETHGYSVSVMTGDVYGAGTDANVFLTIYGDLGDTGERKLSKSETNSNKFERGSVDQFTMEAVDLGQVFKIKIRHDNSLLSPDWYLDQVEVLDLDTEEVFLFQCERWLSKKKEDRRISRLFYVKGYEGVRESENSKKKNLPPALKDVDSNMNKKNKKKKEEIVEELPIIPYHISVSTGLAQDSSTSSRAYVIIVGAGHSQTDRMWLDLSNGRTSFKEGSLDNFECHGSDVGEIKKVELGHDGATPESCWLVDELSVAAPTKGVRYVFACKCWLAKDRGDGLTSRVFNVLDAETITITQKIIYEVMVLTGDVQNAGTDTKIYMSVFGVNGSTEEMFLQKNEDRFERGQQDTFNLEIDDIAPLKKMRVRIDGTGNRPDWFLDKVTLRNLTTKEECLFTYEDWLSKTRGPKRTLVCEMAAVVDDEEMVELTTYIINVKTSDVSGAGTDANVWLIIFGENGDTGTLTMKDSSKSNKFERKQMDTFQFSDILSLGELSKVRVWHDNKGPAPGWHIEYIDVKDEGMDKMFRFPCDRWLAKNEDDGQIMRELPCANNDKLDFNEKTKYEICITTADTDDAETKENGWIVLEGKKGRSKEFSMENSSKKKRFLRGGFDSFEFSSKNLGDIASICLGHMPKDGKKVKGEVFWHVEEVTIMEKELGNRYMFACNAQIPLSAKRDEFMTFECTRIVESFASKACSLVPVKYEIIVITADEKGAGTDAKVFITLYGTNGDSGRRQLRQKFRNLFEREQTDRFILELLDMGDLLRVKMEHDNTGLSPGWLLDRVEVTNTTNGVTTVFLCGKWLDTKKADGQIFRIIYPKY